MFLPGECIVRHGDTGRDIYYIISGAVNGEAGGKLVEKLAAGDVIGERGFFSSGTSFLLNIRRIPVFLATGNQWLRSESFAKRIAAC